MTLGLYWPLAIISWSPGAQKGRAPCHHSEKDLYRPLSRPSHSWMKSKPGCDPSRPCHHFSLLWGPQAQRLEPDAGLTLHALSAPVGSP